MSAPLPEGRDAVTRAVMILAFGGADADHLLAARGVVSAQASAQVVVVDDEGETTIAVASEFWAAALGGPVRHVGAGS